MINIMNLYFNKRLAVSFNEESFDFSQPLLGGVGDCIPY